MAIKWRSEFVSVFNLFRCLILLSLLLFNSSCSFESIERKGDRGDCSDISDGVPDDEAYFLVLEEERNVDELKAALKSWDGTTRYKALWVLIARVEPHTILTTLMTMVQDEDPRVRETSIDGLAKAATSQETLISPILPILIQAMQDKDPGVRVASFGGLTQITRHQKLIPQVFPLLKNGLKDRSACVRARSAEFLLGLIRESKADTNEVKLVIPDLIVVATRDSSAWARSHALFALGEANVASEEIVPVLVRVLKHDPDAGMRSVAASALSNKATEPESTKALIEAISDPDARVRMVAVHNVLRIEPNSLINQSNLKKLSDQGLKTAIWMLERPTEERGGVDGAKNYIPSILKALIAERNSRLQK